MNKEIYNQLVIIAKEVFSKYVKVSKENITLSASDIVRYSVFKQNNPVNCTFLDGSEKIYTINVDTFKCSFRGCDVFNMLVKFEKIAQIKQTEKESFSTGSGIEGKIKAKAKYLKNGDIKCNLRTLYRLSPVIAYITESGKDIFFVLVNGVWFEFGRNISVLYRKENQKRTLEDFKKVFKKVNFSTWENAKILEVLKEEINNYFSDTTTATAGNEGTTTATAGNDGNEGTTTATAETATAETATAGNDHNEGTTTATTGNDGSTTATTETATTGNEGTTTATTGNDGSTTATAETATTGNDDSTTATAGNDDSTTATTGNGSGHDTRPRFAVCLPIWFTGPPGYNKTTNRHPRGDPFICAMDFFRNEDFYIKFTVLIFLINHPARGAPWQPSKNKIMLQVKNILQTTKEALEAGSITLQEAARILCKAGFTNFTDIKATVRLLDINSLSLSMMAEATTATAEKENICTDIQVIEPEEPDEITGTDEGREATASAEKQAEINKNKSFKELKKGDYIRLIQGLGKDNSIKDFLSTFTGDYSPNFPLCKIDRIESLSDEELNNYDFMNRKPENFEGGEISFVYDLFKNRFHLTKEMIKTAVTSVCMLRTPSRCLFIDPEGYSYSRYILALPASFRSMFKKEFEELEEEKRQKEEEKRRKQEEAKRAETEFVESCKSFLTPVCGFDKKTTKKNILAFLKYSFKGVKFTARKDYNTYEISWTDGPTPLEVRAICAHFIDTYFDIYTDYEDYKPTLFTKTFGGISCNVQTNRTYSKEVIKETLQEAKKIYPEIDITTNMLGQTLTMDRNRPNKFYNNHCGLGGIVCLKDLVYNYLKNVSFYENPEETATATAVAGTTGNDETTTATAETATTGSDHKEETTTATTGNDETKGLTLIEYSAKAVAVIGDTFPIKEQLKKLGGRFNARLTCGAGWVFSKKREQELRQALNIA